MKLGFKIVGVPEAAGALNRMGDYMGERTLVKAAVAGALLLVNAWRRKVTIVTGNYFRSIHAKVTVRQPGFVQVTVGTNIVKPPYPWVLEYGMTIKAKNKPYMVFKTKDGSWHSVKVVHIPPKGWARRAFDESQDKVAREIESSLWAMIDQEWAR